MFLSIIIPIWNDEKYLQECLDSCLDQELPRDKYEIICVDDGSTDHTPELLQYYSERYNNIHVITKKHGQQFGNGRTIGYMQARGEFLWFVDHDDIVAPNAVDELLKTVRENHLIDRVTFPCYEFFDTLTEDELALMKRGLLISNDRDCYQDLATWASILRISFLRDHKIFPRSNRIDAAAAFWDIKDFQIWSGDTIFLDECMDNGIKTLRITGRPLYHYRRHNDSETMRTDRAMKQYKKRGKLNTGLVWAYLAYQQKQFYDEERAQYGRATHETTEKTVQQVYRAVFYLLALPSKQWKQGLQCLKEKSVFFSRMPVEYSVNYKQYWSRCSKKERLLLSTVFGYYVLTERGARWYRILSGPIRFLNDNRLYSQYKNNRKKARLKTTGISTK